MPVLFPQPSVQSSAKMVVHVQREFEEDEDDIEEQMNSDTYVQDRAYARGFRDGLQSFILAMRDSATLEDALTTTLEAYGNNAT